MADDELTAKLRERAGDSAERLAELRALWRDLQEATGALWQRSVPFGDGVGDRWERAARLGFGEGASIYDSALVIGDVRVGEQSWIGPWTVLDGSGGLRIGAFCSISAGVQIYTHDTVAWAISGGASPPERKPTTIGSRCYIGPSAIIAMGVTIGDGAVVGTNSFVNSDIPAGSKAFGTPARVVGPATGGDGSPA